MAQTILDVVFSIGLGGDSTGTPPDEANERGGKHDPPPNQGQTSSEQLTLGRARRDAGRREHPCKRHREIVGGVVRIQLECSGIVIPVLAQRDCLHKLSRPRRIPDAAGRVRGITASQPCEVVEMVSKSSRLGPNAHAKVSILRWTRGIHDLHLVVVPLHQGTVDRGVWNGGSIECLRREDHMPHPHYRRRIIIVIKSSESCPQGVAATYLRLPARRLYQLR